MRSIAFPAKTDVRRPARADGSVGGALRIGEPGDSSEREADRVAEEIMAGGRLQWSLSSTGVGSPLHRKCSCGGSGECEECKENRTLQRKIGNRVASPAYAPAIVTDVLQSSGQPLDAGTREFFERRFGHDFGQVRIHADAKAADSAAAVDARAYTVGRQIVFSPRSYRPSSPEGRRLLAHELAHVIQQSPAGAPARVQRQPQGGGSGGALDPDDQKVVDAAQRESAKFKCNVGPILFGILRKHFAEDMRKVAGVGCEEPLPGLRTEFSAVNPKDPKQTRSVPMIYAGKAFIASTDAAHLSDRIAEVGQEIEKIDEWRLANFLIDSKDLSNPRITGPIRSMSAAQLMDYRDKTKDAEVKRYAENLITFSTPTQAGATVDPLSGNMAVPINGVNIQIQPDVRGAAGITGGETKESLELNPVRIPGYDIENGVVKNFPGYAPSATLKIVTRYQAGVTPETPSSYGRGTTPEDIRNKATAGRVHEGSHGEDYIDFVRNNPLPIFMGKNGDRVRDFEAAKRAYLSALSTWRKQINDLSITKTDCVGKTIDEFHKGEPGYKRVCP
jgi:Domain of unknown function (DUF4157)